MAYAMEYCRLDGEDEGLGGSGAPAALRKTRVLEWQGRHWALKKSMARWLWMIVRVAVELRRRGGIRRRGHGWDGSDS